MFHLLLSCQFLISSIQEMLKVIKTFIMRKCIYMKQGQQFILFQRYFNVMHFLGVMIFRWTNFFRVIANLRGALLIWFAKISTFEGFCDNELSWSFSKFIHWVVLLLMLLQQASEVTPNSFIFVRHIFFAQLLQRNLG